MLLEKILDWHNETLKTLQRNLAEFLQEETRDLPARAEVEWFNCQVEKLESDVKKLEEKLNHKTGKTQ
jgi:ubiquinone biosynthesis accessory factor UbiJ